MAKCLLCGKSGIFLKINDMGICGKCIKARRAAEERRYAQRYAIENAWRLKHDKLFKTHESLQEQIHQLYSIASSQKAFYSQSMETCITLCIEDIKLIPFLRHAILEWDELERQFINTSEGVRPHSENYPTYSRLAIIYEKRKEYEKAVEVCKEAIINGQIRDGSKGGMHGRLSRLCRKAGIEFDVDAYVADALK